MSGESMLRLQPRRCRLRVDADRLVRGPGGRAGRDRRARRPQRRRQVDAAPGGHRRRAAAVRRDHRRRGACHGFRCEASVPVRLRSSRSRSPSPSRSVPRSSSRWGGTRTSRASASPGEIGQPCGRGVDAPHRHAAPRRQARRRAVRRRPAAARPRPGACPGAAAAAARRADEPPRPQPPAAGARSGARPGDRTGWRCSPSSTTSTWPPATPSASPWWRRAGGAEAAPPEDVIDAEMLRERLRGARGRRHRAGHRLGHRSRRCFARVRSPRDRAARVLVIGGSGVATPLMRDLVLAGWDVTVGRSQRRRRRRRSGRRARDRVRADPPVRADGRDRGRRCRASWRGRRDAVVVCDVPFGNGNVGNLRGVRPLGKAPGLLVGEIEVATSRRTCAPSCGSKQLAPALDRGDDRGSRRSARGAGARRRAGGASVTSRESLPACRLAASDEERRWCGSESHATLCPATVTGTSRGRGAPGRVLELRGSEVLRCCWCASGAARTRAQAVVGESLERLGGAVFDRWPVLERIRRLRYAG